MSSWTRSSDTRSGDEVAAALPPGTMAAPYSGVLAATGPLDPWDVLLAGPRPDAVRIGLAVPLSGPLALTAPSALDLAGLAVDEANEAGGVAGRTAELVALDFGRAPDLVAAETVALHAAGAFDVLVGFHTSDVHRAVETALAGRVRYVFTPPHGGGRPRFPPRRGGPAAGRPASSGSASRRASSTPRRWPGWSGTDARGGGCC